MKTDIPLDAQLAEIQDDLQRGDAATNGWNAPTASLAIGQGIRAGRALAEVLDAVGDLEPGPALIITDAITRGLDARL
jgi:hypothetical protein